MIIAIHPNKGSFSDHWIAYCKEKNIPFKLVNCYDSNIIGQLSDCCVLMWHHHHTDYRDALIAKDLLFALTQGGKLVFPDFNTGWHFDDKIAQKYLFESVDIPIIPSYVFYCKFKAMDWAKKTGYPKVFKLRGGAGATHVKLVNSFSEASHIINKAFNSGFPQFDKIENLKARWKDKNVTRIIKIAGICKAVIRLVKPTLFSSVMGREKGYVYFQDFAPNNDYDIRLIVIDNKAFGMKRLNRDGDFRASGSGRFIYDQLPKEVIEIGFKTSKLLGLQAAAYDFIFNEQGEPVILEISYCYGTTGSSVCKGYWDSNLKWHEGSFNPYGWLIDSILKNQKVNYVQ